MMDEVAEFRTERNLALQSMDRQTIDRFMSRWNPTSALPDSDLAFWASVHKAITGCEDLPEAFREKSRRWLALRNMTDWS